MKDRRYELPTQPNTISGIYIYIIYYEELTLFNKGLKYILNYKHKDWITTVALKAETAINQLPILDQEHIRHQVATNLKKLYTQYDTH